MTHSLDQNRDHIFVRNRLLSGQLDIKHISTLYIFFCTRYTVIKENTILPAYFLLLSNFRGLDKLY